jgi:hypothetical protein
VLFEEFFGNRIGLASVNRDPADPDRAHRAVFNAISKNRQAEA